MSEQDVVQLSELTDEELVSLAEQIAHEQDRRKPLDPEPWTWRNDSRAPRRAWGPQNDGPPQPRGRLSELLPRPQYRQDLSAYAHTAHPYEEDPDLKGEALTQAEYLGDDLYSLKPEPKETPHA